jgi:hypothetical protein
VRLKERVVGSNQRIVVVSEKESGLYIKSRAAAICIYVPRFVVGELHAGARLHECIDATSLINVIRRTRAPELIMCSLLCARKCSREKLHDHYEQREADDPIFRNKYR